MKEYEYIVEVCCYCRKIITTFDIDTYCGGCGAGMETKELILVEKGE